MAIAVEAPQKRPEHVEALRLQRAAVLAFAACTAIQRLRKEQDAGDQVAVELAALGLAEPAAAVIEPRPARAAADGAGDGSSEVS